MSSFLLDQRNGYEVTLELAGPEGVRVRRSKVDDGPPGAAIGIGRLLDKCGEKWAAEILAIKFFEERPPEEWEEFQCEWDDVQNWKSDHGIAHDILDLALCEATDGDGLDGEYPRTLAEYHSRRDAWIQECPMLFG